MLKGLILASYSAYDGEIGNLLAQWEQLGLFSYLLPFLLIFAVVFGILGKINIFKDKAVNGVIAIVVGLMALQFNFVAVFFSEIFPRLGIGLSIILIAIILMGMFLETKQSGLLLLIGAVVFIVVLVNTAGAIGWSSGDWWRDNWAKILPVVGILSLVGLIWSKSNPKEKSDYDSMFARLIPKE